MNSESVHHIPGTAATTARHFNTSDFSHIRGFSTVSALWGDSGSSGDMDRTTPDRTGPAPREKANMVCWFVLHSQLEKSLCSSNMTLNMYVPVLCVQGWNQDCTDCLVFYITNFFWSLWCYHPDLNKCIVSKTHIRLNGAPTEYRNIICYHGYINVINSGVGGMLIKTGEQVYFDSSANVVFERLNKYGAAPC